VPCATCRFGCFFSLVPYMNASTARRIDPFPLTWLGCPPLRGERRPSLPSWVPVFPLSIRSPFLDELLRSERRLLSVPMKKIPTFLRNCNSGSKHPQVAVFPFFSGTSAFLVRLKVLIFLFRVQTHPLFTARFSFFPGRLTLFFPFPRSDLLRGLRRTHSSSLFTVYEA